MSYVYQNPESGGIGADHTGALEWPRHAGVSDHTFYRWRQQYGGLRIDQARRLREMEAENGRLRRAVADLTLDNQIPREAAGGDF